MAAGQMLLALDRYLGPTHELVLAGDGGKLKEAAHQVESRYLPRAVFARTDGNGKSPLLAELFAGKSSPKGEPVLYVCENFACQEPAVGLPAIGAALDELS